MSAFPSSLDTSEIRIRERTMGTMTLGSPIGPVLYRTDCSWSCVSIAAGDSVLFVECESLTVHCILLVLLVLANRLFFDIILSTIVCKVLSRV